MCLNGPLTRERNSGLRLEAAGLSQGRTENLVHCQVQPRAGTGRRLRGLVRPTGHLDPCVLSVPLLELLPWEATQGCPEAVCDWEWGRFRGLEAWAVLSGRGCWPGWARLEGGQGLPEFLAPPVVDVFHFSQLLPRARGKDAGHQGRVCVAAHQCPTSCGSVPLPGRSQPG